MKIQRALFVTKKELAAIKWALSVASSEGSEEYHSDGSGQKYLPVVTKLMEELEEDK